jgi:uncharacterized protein (DUF488 family)
LTQTGGVKLYTVGHSNQPVAALVETLAAAGVRRLADVRRYPRSRRNPQFNSDALARALQDNGIAYTHRADLGGRREPRPDSPNTGLRDRGFRGFADYMQTAEFAAAMTSLVEDASKTLTAIMCAESLPWRCHRSLISDALVARGVEVEHLIGATRRQHALTASARVEDGRVCYPSLL